jgi:hypothetical protein
MTNQEMFNKVWQHFVVEENPASVDRESEVGNGCFYRSPEGNKCAFGVLIPDEFYHEKMEGFTAISLIRGKECENEGRGMREYFGKVDAIFISDLQEAHDDNANDYIGSNFTDAIEVDLKKLAEEYNLEVPNG